MVEIRQQCAAVHEFRVTPALVAHRHAVQRPAVLAPHGEGWMVPLGGGLVQQRRDAAAVQFLWHRQPAEFGERRIKIQRLHHARARLAVALRAGRANDERHAGALLEQGAGLRPLAPFTELVAVIAPEHDDGVRPQVEAVQFGEHAADVGVHVGSGREVGADHFLRRLGRGVAADEQVRIFGAD